MDVLISSAWVVFGFSFSVLSQCVCVLFDSFPQHRLWGSGSGCRLPTFEGGLVLVEKAPVTEFSSPSLSCSSLDQLGLPTESFGSEL